MWLMPVIPALENAEAGGSLEPGRRRLQWANIVPLYLSLGNKARFHPKKKKFRGSCLCTRMTNVIIQQPQRNYYYLHFTDEHTGSWRVGTLAPNTEQHELRRDSDPRQSDSRVEFLIQAGAGGETQLCSEPLTSCKVRYLFEVIKR